MNAQGTNIITIASARGKGVPHHGWLSNIVHIKQFGSASWTKKCTYFVLHTVDYVIFIYSNNLDNKNHKVNPNVLKTGKNDQYC